MPSGMALLAALLPTSMRRGAVAAPSAGHPAGTLELGCATERLMGMSMTSLRAASTGDLADAVDAAIGEGRGIGLIGLAPTDLRIQGMRFSARIALRLESEPILRTIAVEGDLGDGPSIDHAVQTGARPILRHARSAS